MYFISLFDNISRKHKFRIYNMIDVHGTYNYMVTQNMLCAHEGKQVFSEKKNPICNCSRLLLISGLSSKYHDNNTLLTARLNYIRKF